MRACVHACARVRERVSESAVARVRARLTRASEVWYNRNMTTTEKDRMAAAREAYTSGAEEYAFEMRQAGRWNGAQAAHAVRAAYEWVERQVDANVVMAHGDRLWSDAEGMAEARVERAWLARDFEMRGV